MSDEVYHIPALLNETIESLNIYPDGSYLDVTFGGGGHSRAILSRLGPEGRIFGLDQDIEALQNVPDDARFTFVHSNFRYAQNFMRFYDALPLDGILADLGVSFHHFDTPERGFSFRSNAPLDMRMNQNAPVTAAQIINDSDEQRLLSMLRLYGDMKNPRPVVSAILKARKTEPITSTTQLAEIISPVLNPRQLKKELAQVFQALRIEVNGEMDVLQKFLQSTISMLAPGGRLAILTYHSLEDRMVKNFMRTGNIEGRQEKDFFGKVNTPWKVITRQPIVASPEEVEANPRSRSAKLRVAELIKKND